MTKKIIVDSASGELEFTTDTVFYYWETKEGTKYVETYQLVDTRKMGDISTENKIRYLFEAE